MNVIEKVKSKISKMSYEELDEYKMKVSMSSVDQDVKNFIYNLIKKRRIEMNVCKVIVESSELDMDFFKGQYKI